MKRFRPSSPTSTPPPSWSEPYPAETTGTRPPLTEFSNPPAAPEATSARTLAWTGLPTAGRYTGGSPITGYRIELHEAGAGLVATAESTATGDTPPTATFTGLTAGTTYAVRVAALNAAGLGEPSDFSAPATTPAGSTPGSRPPSYTDRDALADAIRTGRVTETTGPTVEQGTDATITIPWTPPQAGEAWWFGDATFAARVGMGIRSTAPTESTPATAQPETTGQTATAGQTATTGQIPTTALTPGTHWLLLVTDAELDGDPAPAGAPATAIRITVTPATAGTRTLDDAVLRWGLNDESNNGAYFGGCNFLSAGRAPDPGGSKLFTPAQFASTSGSVSIQKPDAEGRFVPASWQSKCLDRTGAPLSSGTTTPYGGSQFVMTGGVGVLDRASGSATVRWDGDVTVVYYGGLTFWYLSDPQLTIENGTGILTATVGGFGTDMDDQTKWQPLADRTITLATFSGVQVGDDGFTVTPDYRGVQVSLGAGSVPQSRAGADWGSFPQSFVDFQSQTGQAAYWYSSGGQADGAKPATPFVVGYDAATFRAPAAAPVATAEQTGARVPTVRLPPAKVPVIAAPGRADATAAGLGSSAAASSVVVLETPAPAQTLTQTELVLLIALVAALGIVILVAGAGGGIVLIRGQSVRKN